MLNKVVNLFLLTLPFLLNSCSKHRDKGPSQFVVTGIHDVILDSSNSYMLPITVMQTSGERYPVAIEVVGLPQQIPIAIYPSELGVPDFNAELNFSREVAPKGIYPVKVVATSAFYRTEDSMLVIAAGNEFTINGLRDVSLNSLTYTDTMPVTVAYASGIRYPVTLTLDRPLASEGVQVYFQPSSGTPDFTSKIIFKGIPSVLKPGTYQIFIGGSNHSGAKYYPVNVTMP